jgi:hypothetical protein
MRQCLPLIAALLATGCGVGAEQAAGSGSEAAQVSEASVVSDTATLSELTVDRDLHKFEVRCFGDPARAFRVSGFFQPTDLHGPPTLYSSGTLTNGEGSPSFDENTVSVILSEPRGVLLQVRRPTWDSVTFEPTFTLKNGRIQYPATRWTPAGGNLCELYGWRFDSHEWVRVL